METSQVIIRPARPEEGEALAVIEATCFPPAEAASREAVLERLATFPENFLVAEIDGKAIGFINGANTNTQYLPDAMAYVPCQGFTTTYDLGYALSVGTIFPQLCKPFCGKRGGCK